MIDTTRYKEFTRPMPVDHVYRGGHQDPAIPACVGLQCRAHVATFDETPDDPRLLQYRRTEWAVFKKEVRQALMRFGIAKTSAGSTLSRTINDVNGTPRALKIYAPSASAASLFNATDAFNNDEIQLAVGTDGTAATEDDNDLLAGVLSLTASTFNSTAGVETVNISATATGTYTGANVTLREAALRTAWNLDGVTRPRFLLDRVTYAGVPLNTNNRLYVQFDLVI